MTGEEERALGRAMVGFERQQVRLKKRPPLPCDTTVPDGPPVDQYAWEKDKILQCLDYYPQLIPSDVAQLLEISEGRSSTILVKMRKAGLLKKKTITIRVVRDGNSDMRKRVAYVLNDGKDRGADDD